MKKRWVDKVRGRFATEQDKSGRWSGGQEASGEEGSSYEAEAQTLFDAMTSEPDDARKTVINQLVKDLKGIGNTGTTDYWNDYIDEVQVYSGHTDQASLLGWKRVKDATAVNSPSFTEDRGFFTDGSTSYVRTNWDPATDGVKYTLDSCSFFFYMLDGNTSDIGGNGARGSPTGSTPKAQIQHSRILSGAWMNVDTTTGTPAANQSPNWGQTGGVRTADNESHAYRHGAIVDTDSVASTSLTSSDLAIGGRLENTTFAEPMQAEYAYWFVGGALTEAQVGEIKAALDTYLMAVGAI